MERQFQDDSHYETEITTVQLSPRVKVRYSRRHLGMEYIMTSTAHLQSEGVCVCVFLYSISLEVLICLIRDISDGGGGGGGSQGAQCTKRG